MRHRLDGHALVPYNSENKLRAAAVFIVYCLFLFSFTYCKRLATIRSSMARSIGIRPEMLRGIGAVFELCVCSLEAPDRLDGCGEKVGCVLSSVGYAIATCALYQNRVDV